MDKTRTLIIGIIGLLVGLFIGLVVLGWWLMPVTWVNGTLENVNQETREQYLRMAIDSYTLNQNAELATQSYNQLGAYKESTLSEVYLSPEYQDQASIAAFAQAVGASEVIASTTPIPPPISAQPEIIGRTITQPIYAGLCCGLFLIFIGAIAVWLILRNSNKKAGPPAIEQSEDQSIAPPSPESEELEVAQPEQEVALPDWAVAPAEKAEEPFQFDDLINDKPQEGVSPAAFGAVAGAAIGAVAFAGDREEELSAEQQEGETAELASDLDAGDDRLEYIEKPEEPFQFEDLSNEEPQDGINLVAFGAAAAGVAVGAVAVADNRQEEIVEELQSDELTDETLAPGIENEISGPAVVATELDETGQPVEAVEFTETEESTDAAEESPDQTMAKFSRNLQYVEGIGPAYSQKLQDIGIQTPAALLKRGNTAKGREEIAEQTGISPSLILTWVNHVDLYRVKGIGSEYADLLEAAGVDTVVELSRRNPENLHLKLGEVNTERGLVRLTPSLSAVSRWIDSAKRLPRVVTH
jgi:predicted flap endonuclease-1-like 5' DNA nuclease